MYRKKNFFSFVKCYLYSSHWKHTNAKRWHNTLARHSRQFTLHTHSLAHTHTHKHTHIHLLFARMRDVSYTRFTTPRVCWLLLFASLGCVIITIIMNNNIAAFCTLFRLQIYNCIWISLISMFRFIFILIFTYNLFYECNCCSSLGVEHQTYSSWFCFCCFFCVPEW